MTSGIDTPGATEIVSGCGDEEVCLPLTWWERDLRILLELFQLVGNILKCCCRSVAAAPSNISGRRVCKDFADAWPSDRPASHVANAHLSGLQRDRAAAAASPRGDDRRNGLCWECVVGPSRGQGSAGADRGRTAGYR